MKEFFDINYMKKKVTKNKKGIIIEGNFEKDEIKGNLNSLLIIEMSKNEK